MVSSEVGVWDSPKDGVMRKGSPTGMFIGLHVSVLTLMGLAIFAAAGSTADVTSATAAAITTDSNGDNAPLPDFDGDGTVGFGDFVKFAAKFGLGEGDEGYDAQYDLNGDGQIGFADFVTFAQSFGKSKGDVGSGNSDTEGSGGTGEGVGPLTIGNFVSSDDSLTAAQAFTLEATVYNQGAEPRSTWLYYYRSSDATIDRTDVLVHEDWSSVVDLEPSATQTVLLDWKAPPYAGTYYYGVCTWVKCSTAAHVTVEGSEDGTPDLVVHSPFVSHERVAPGGRFSYRMEIENTGTGPAAPTAMRFYRSDDATIDATDTQLSHSPVRRLEVGQKWRDGYIWSAPIEAGMYYHGICVEPTIGETNTENNCSTGVPIVVEGSEEGNPDLSVVAPLTLDYKPATGEFILWASVRNTGSSLSTATTIRYFRSDDKTIDVTDAQVGTGDINPISVDATYESGIYIKAPTSPGTYYYGACVDPVPGESDTNNNCSEAMPVNLGVPDLAVGLAWVSTSVPLAGQSFTMMATVRNQGPEAAGSTTLRYYRSDDATIDASDTPVGAGDVGSLTGIDGLIGWPGSRPAASGTSRESITVSAPSTPGIYYYGACADGVSGEANTDNNCSEGIYVRVVPAEQDPFNIELVFVSDFTDAQKDVMQQAARRFETIITEGLPAVDFSANPHELSFGDGTIVVDDAVDDLRIFVYKDEVMEHGGSGGWSYVRSGNPTGLPAVGQVWIGARNQANIVARKPRWHEEHLLRRLMLHETAHVLGFGTLWADAGLRHELTGDTYFSGELAIQAFNAAGGEDYRGNKVPAAYGYGGSGGCGAGGAHWRESVFGGPGRRFAELMEPGPARENALSAITIQSFADLGYVVDVSRADPYRLPASVSTAVTRPSIADPTGRYVVDSKEPGPIYVGDEQGNVIRTIDP